MLSKRNLLLAGASLQGLVRQYREQGARGLTVSLLWLPPPPGSPNRLCFSQEGREQPRAERQMRCEACGWQPQETALRHKSCVLSRSPPSFPFNKGQREGGRRQLSPGQNRRPRETVSSPSLGVCRQSADESQLGLERPLTFHGRHRSPVQVWRKKTFAGPRIRDYLRSGTELRIGQSQTPVAVKGLCA